MNFSKDIQDNHQKHKIMSMLNNFFGKPNNEAKQSQAAQPSITTKYPTIVEQIHAEFDIAGELILQEARKIISESSMPNAEKANRLKALGFINVAEVHEVDKKISQIKMSQELADTIQYYKRKYPLNKFITKEQVETICEKYGLIYGEVKKFKGFVPDKNLKEIEKFKVHQEDLPFAILESGLYSAYVRDVEEHEIIDKWAISRLQEGGHFYVDNPIVKRVNFDASELGEYARISPAVKTLHIAAPAKDFDTTGMEIRNYKLQEHPDPVVLQPVKKGYLILSCWGDEASDPIVVNDINN